MATPVKKAIDLPVMPPRYEACPDFAPGAVKAGKWAVNASQTPNGWMFFCTYDGKNIDTSLWSVMFGAFDINEYEGKGSSTCKLSGTAILLPVLPPQAKEAVIKAFGQLRADQGVFKDMLLKFIAAHPEVLASTKDGNPDETGLEHPIAITALKHFPLVKLKPPKVNPAKTKQDMTPIWQSACSLQTDKTDKDNVRIQKVITAVVINGKAVVNPNRGELYELIKGKRYLMHTVGEYRAFMSPKGELYQQSTAKIIRLQQLKSTGEVTPEEMATIVSSTTDLFASMGLEVGFVEEDHSADPQTPGGAPAAGYTTTPGGLEGFKEVEPGKK